MDPWAIANVTMEAIIAATSAIGNGLVLVILLKNKSLQTVTNVLIASLAAADMLVGLVGIPCVIATLYAYPHNFYGCLLVTCMIIILTQVSIFNLLSVAVERFIAIKHPFFYNEHFTLRVTVGIASFNWFLGIVIGLVPLGWNLGWNELNMCVFVWVTDFNYRVYFNYFCFILTPLLIMLIIYCNIFAVVRRQARQIMSLEVSTGNASGDGHQKSSVRREMKAAKKFSVVIGFFALCWCPLETMNAVALWTGKVCLPCVIVAVWLSHLNSAVNPLLYAYGNSVMRRALWKALRCQFTSSLEDNESSTMSTTAPK